VSFRAGITDYLFTQVLEGDLKEGDVLVTGQEQTAKATQGQFPGGPRVGGPPRR
jgi:hypothetical protein